MIAMLIFSVGILATVSMQISSMNANTLARQITEAGSSSASVIENLRPLDYMRAVELADGDTTLPNQDQFNVSYNIQRDAIIDNTMLIQVTVTWMVGGVQKTMNLVGIKPDII
jgi:Tfp pilus assembly protein PilV